MEKAKIGQIGTGWIGANYSSMFEERGYEVIRYSLEEPYIQNKDKIKEANIIFVAVPTPTTKEGFQDFILIDAIKETSPGQIVVIKSTIKIGTTDKIQKLFPDRYIIHSPEFLTEKTARQDAFNPARNIIGYTEKSKCKASEVMNVLPCAPYEKIVPCKEAEMVKYAGNIWFYMKVLTANLIYDVSNGEGLDYDLIKDMLSADKRIGRTHLDIVHQGGRGAGGHCFIKDFATFRDMYLIMNCESSEGLKLVQSAEAYNNYLLSKTNKDTKLKEGVYGKKETI